MSLMISGAISWIVAITSKIKAAERRMINSHLVNALTFIRAAADAIKQVFGKETVYIRSGGSIPIVGLFDQYLGFRVS